MVESRCICSLSKLSFICWLTLLTQGGTQGSKCSTFLWIFLQHLQSPGHSFSTGTFIQTKDIALSRLEALKTDTGPSSFLQFQLLFMDSSLSLISTALSPFPLSKCLLCYTSSFSIKVGDNQLTQTF